MAVRVSLPRFAGGLRVANRADGTTQHDVASVRRFEAFLGCRATA